ncbi:MAG TPA: hypothetical protein VME70_04935, partial [Mycobacteriales bacterium]|nr:hypothetical protein [Mycobacteriales bacterium]
MSLGWVDDPELDAAHARAAVLIGEAEQLAPGPGLAAALVRLQGLVMDCSTAVRTTVLWDRLTAWTQAQAMISATEAVTAADLPVFLEGEDTARLVGQELAVRTATSYGTQSRRLALVDQVARELPAAWVALDRGALSLAHVSRLAGELRSCPPGLAGQVDGRLVPQAVEHGWTPAQLARAARRELIAADPAGAADRAETAK